MKTRHLSVRPSIEALQERLLPSVTAGVTGMSAAGAAVASANPDAPANSSQLEAPLIQVINGDLYIYGTNAADNVAVTHEGRHISVNENGQIQRVRAARVTSGRIWFSGYQGNDFFKYRQGTASYAQLLRVIAYGMEGNDTLDGGNKNDYLDGGDGVDILSGWGGNDTLQGGLGQDYLFGSWGHDQLFAGNDSSYNYLDGGRDNDSLYGGNGGDYLVGNSGDDWLFGDAGNDTLKGGRGGDHSYGGAGDDMLYGDFDGSYDMLYGEAGRDTFRLQVKYDPDPSWITLTGSLLETVLGDVNNNGGSVVSEDFPKDYDRNNDILQTTF